MKINGNLLVFKYFWTSITYDQLFSNFGKNVAISAQRCIAWQEVDLEPKYKRNVKTHMLLFNAAERLLAS